MVLPCPNKLGRHTRVLIYTADFPSTSPSLVNPNAMAIAALQGVETTDGVNAACTTFDAAQRYAVQAQPLVLLICPTRELVMQIFDYCPGPCQELLGA